MKKLNLLSFLLGGLMFLTIGAGVATSTDVLTVKPAVPKSVYHAEFTDYSKLSSMVSLKTKEGYVVKYIVTNSGSMNDAYRGFVVMEKY